MKWFLYESIFSCLNLCEFFLRTNTIVPERLEKKVLFFRDLNKKESRSFFGLGSH